MNKKNMRVNYFIKTAKFFFFFSFFRHIRRIIFYSLIKPTINKNGEKEMNLLSVSSALQIAGRAGRFKTQWETVYLLFEIVIYS